MNLKLWDRLDREASREPWLIKHEFHVETVTQRGVASCGGYQSNFEDGVYEQNKANADFITFLRNNSPKAREIIRQAKKIARIRNERLEALNSPKWVDKVSEWNAELDALCALLEEVEDEL